MNFGASGMGVWLWVVPGTIFFYVLAERSRKKALERFASADLLKTIAGVPRGRRRNLKRGMIVAALLLALIALMRPQWGFKWQEVKRQGIDILIALDTSRSMMAEDVLPNRLERSKLAIKDLIRKLKGDRIGLIAFSGTAFLQSPLTVDYDGFLLALDDIHVDTIPIGGTSLSKAIYTSIKSYEGGKKKNKVLIIITDGEDLEGGIDRAIEKAKANGIKIFCVGIGTTEGELIPVDSGSGRREFLKDPEGNIVKTRLVESILKKIALSTGGIYLRAGGVEFGLELIYDEKLSKLEKQEFKSRMEKRFHERFQIPLVLAFLLLLFEALIGERAKSS